MGISTRTWREQRLFLEQSQSRRSRRPFNVSGENGHDAPSREQQHIGQSMKQLVSTAAALSLSSTATHSQYNTNIRFHCPDQRVLLSLTHANTRSTPQLACDREAALLLPPPANPACARPPRLRPRPAPSVDTIDPLPVETQGPLARSSEHFCTRRHPRNPPRPWLYRPLRVAASRSMPVSPDTHHLIPILYYRRPTLPSTLSTDTCYYQTSMPTQILPCLLADPPTTTPLLERRHPAHPYLL